MKPRLPGQAALTRLDGLVSLVACDHKENLRLAGASFEIRTGLYTVLIEGVDVPAVNEVGHAPSYSGHDTYRSRVEEIAAQVMVWAASIA